MPVTAAMSDPLERARRWLVGDFERAAGAIRLVAFPHAGAGASALLGFRDLMPPGVEWFTVRLPGRESRVREAPLAEFRPLMDALVDALGRFLAPPYALFGHSMGALIAFELARTLADRGHPEPVALFLSASSPPEEHTAEWRDRVMDEEAVRATLRDGGGTPDAILLEDELLQLVLPVLRADLALCCAYQFAAGTVLSCPIVALGGQGDSSAPPDQLDGWARHTRGRFRRAVFPGGHFYLDAHRRAVAGEMASELTGGHAHAI